MHYDHNISKESHQIKLYVVLKDAIGPSWRFDLIFRFMICNCDSSIAVNGIFVYTIVLAANANYLHNPTYGSFHKNDSIQLVHFNAPTYRRFTNEFFHIRSLWLVGIFFFSNSQFRQPSTVSKLFPLFMERDKKWTNFSWLPKIISLCGVAKQDSYLFGGWQLQPDS